MTIDVAIAVALASHLIGWALGILTTKRYNPKLCNERHGTIDARLTRIEDKLDELRKEIALKR